MLSSDKTMLIAVVEAENNTPLLLNPRMANRHGLITGATGTGKTVTLQTLAESFSALGVPVLLTDVKGDMAGVSQPGQPTGGIAARIDELGLRNRGYANQAFPVCFWDAAPAPGQAPVGHPLRATVSDLGPLLLARLLELNDVQSGVLNIIFHIADDKGLLLLDFKDLRSMTAWVADNRSEFAARYGNIAPASIGAIQRGLLRLEDEGADLFFGEPALRIEDLLLTDLNGRGMINILAADRLMLKPRLYAAVLLWLLSELYENLPETGDADRPRLALMFDEAHLLFADMPSALLEKIEQVVRLIRSKGVSVWFITQTPADVPETVLAQLGNRVQHALRAYTPRDRKALKAAADSFRPNPAFSTEDAISNLRTGEALVSFLNAKGDPAVVERALILPPQGALGPISAQQRAELLRTSRMAGRYDSPVDRESAYELLTVRVEERQRAEQADKDAEARHKAEELQRKEDARRLKEEERQHREAEREAKRREKENPDLLGGIFRDVTRQAKRTVTNSVGREIGKTIIRGVLGSLFGGRK